jgi:uncharacterized protein
VTWVIVSLHDVASATAEPSRRWMSLFEDRDMRVSVLVVPGPWRGFGPVDRDRPLCSWLRSRRDAGHDIAQHGWTHIEPENSNRGLAARAAGRLAARGCAEFWHLGGLEAARRLTLGRSVLRAAGLEPSGFVAPGWLTSPEARVAVAASGFGYITSHTTVSDLAGGREWTCPVLSQRPGSSITGPGAVATRHIAEWTVRRGRPLRIAAHPADLDDRRTTEAVLAACDTALGCQRRVKTDPLSTAQN